MKTTFALLQLIMLLIIQTSLSQNNNNYSIIYEANSKGEVINGNLDLLVQYVQNGNPVRVGWVLEFKNPDPNSDEIIEMQHWADAGFITTLKGHVFAQISSIYQQGPAISSPPGVFLVNDQPNGWVAILGTTGVMKQKYTRDPALLDLLKKSGLTDEEINTRLQEQETMNVHTKWAVLNKN